MNDRDAAIRRASRLWWVFLLRGVAGLLLGISVLLGGENTSTLASFIAVYWLVGALLTIRWVLANRWRPGSRLAMAAAVTGILAASLVLVRNVLEDEVPIRFTLVTLGLAAFLTGVLRLFGAFHDDDESVVGKRRAKRLVLGTLEVVLGLLLVFAEDLTRLLVVVAGIWGLVGGTILMLDSLSLRRLSRTRPPKPGVRASGA